MISLEDLSGIFSDWCIAGNLLSELETGHYSKRIVMIFTYLRVLSWNLCCQNIYASMSKYLFIIIVYFHLKTECKIRSAKSWKDTKESPVKITFRGIHILQMMFYQWWLPHTKNCIKINSLNPRTITCLSSTQGIQEALYQMKIHPWLVRSSTKSLYFGS